jgi:DNA-binding transcriptional MerR regulator
MDEFSIGAAAARSGVKVPTIRYYEHIGLLSAPTRSDSNRRLFGERDLRRLLFIRHARELGFEIDAIKTLLVLQDNPDQSCATADLIARARLAEVEQRLVSLTALKGELEAMITSCGRGVVADCQVIEVLADHGKCVHGKH